MCAQGATAKEKGTEAETEGKAEEKAEGEAKKPVNNNVAIKKGNFLLSKVRMMEIALSCLH